PEGDAIEDRLARLFQSGRTNAIVAWSMVAVLVDASLGMLARARDGRGLAGVAGDAGRLPFRDDAVDAVAIVDAFHHLPDQDAALREVARVLAPGGALVIREFDPAHPLGRALVAAEHAIGMASRFRTPSDLAAAFDDVGLDPRIVDRGFGYTVAGVKRGE
ncbi:class I SAM-dependent methyltransferase, partial [Halorubrum sp. Eb13]|uniref:class I SAM-dependent methyltransferase n=1 Tax=Halorubrum sp. Eb13 TaxID=1383843 RepID=UPI00113FCD81